MKAGVAVALMAIALLCVADAEQESSADYWYRTGQNLSANGSYNESIQAVERAK